MTHPRTEALAYRIWAYAAPREWNVTGKDIAEALGLPFGAVGMVLQAKGWHNRTRAGSALGALGTGGGAMLASERYVLRDMGLERVGHDEA